MAMFLESEAVAVPAARQHRQVFDIAQTRTYLVMEYVDGCNLKALSDRPPSSAAAAWGLPQAIHVMVEACKALSYAHHAENRRPTSLLHIVHRDISPPKSCCPRWAR